MIMLKEGKMMVLVFFIIYMLLPLTGDLMNPWILAVLIAAAGLAAVVASGKGRNMLAPERFHQELWMGAAAVLSFGMAAACENGAFGTKRGGEIFVYVGLLAALFYVMRVQDTIRMAQFDLVFYIGSAILLLYLVSYAVAADMLLVPVCLLSDQTVTNAVGIVNAMIAVWGFCREKERMRRAMYCAGGVVAFLVVALNDTPGMMILLLAGIYGFILTMPPGEVYIKRGLSLFIGAAFLTCNLSLVLDYTELFRLKGLSYSLQGSVLAELLLSVFTLYVVSIWDRLKENGELNKKGLSLLQKKLKKLAAVGGKLFLVFLLFGGIHLWVGLDNFMLLFFGEKWAVMQEGIIISVLADWVIRISGALAGLWKGNVLACCFQAGGVIGLLIGTAVIAWSLWRSINGLTARKNMRLAVVVCGEIYALMLLAPVSLELLPFYAVWIYLFICDLQPRTGKKAAQEEAETAQNRERYSFNRVKNLIK